MTAFLRTAWRCQLEWLQGELLVSLREVHGRLDPFGGGKTRVLARLDEPQHPDIVDAYTRKGVPVMNESKIGLTERLRREGRWAEASRFKDEIVRKLRAEGMKRAEASEKAWQEMAETYPALAPVEPTPESAAAESQRPIDTVDEATLWICNAAQDEVERWQQKYGVVLPEDARAALVGEQLMYFWAMGLMGEMPGRTSCQSGGGAELDLVENAGEAA